MPASAPAGWQGEPPGTGMVANRPLIAHALESLREAGCDRLAVIAAESRLPELELALHDDAGAPDGEIALVGLDGPDDLPGALSRVAAFSAGEPCAVHLATGLLGQSLEPVVRAFPLTDTDVLMLVHHGELGDLLLGSATESLLGVIELEGSGSHLSLAGVCLFSGRALARLAEGVPAPSGDLVGVAEALAAEGLTLEAGQVAAWHRYTAEPADLLELNRSVLDRQIVPAARLIPGENRIEGRVVIDSTAEVSSSVVLGPSNIAAGARVIDSYVGPYTTIGPGAIVEGSEVVRSIVAEGARISHVGGRIEGSTIGRGASIFRDFSLPRAMRLHVGEGVEVALE